MAKATDTIAITNLGFLQRQATLWLGRRLLNQFITQFVPSLLICIVSFCTNFFPVEAFEAVVGVNLTTLLCATALFISVSERLPKTAYLKLIDVWRVNVNEGGAAKGSLLPGNLPTGSSSASASPFSK